MSESKTHIAQLLQNICLRDDQKSFEEIFKLFYERLLRFCIHYINDRQTSEEIVSDVLFRIWAKRNELSHVQNLETYLFIAVKNQSLNYLKQFSNYRVAYLSDAGIHQLVNTRDPGKEMERRELIFKMNQAIETLPQQCKIVFNLVKEEGLKYKEVAQILNISPRTVETQLVRALQKLDKILSPYILADKAPVKARPKRSSTIKSIFFSLIF